MKKTLLTAGVALAFAACGDTPSTPLQEDRAAALPAADARAGGGGPGLSDLEQSLLDQYLAGADMGAVINRDVPCASIIGFFNDGQFAAFGGLFPNEGPDGTCPTGNFERTNPDGTIDIHLKGSGGFFLFVPGAGFYGSEGSKVNWRIMSHEDGARSLNISGTLSDGSRVRAHFNTTPGGENPRGNTLWVGGLGYVVGGPSKG